MSDKLAARPGSLEPLADVSMTYRYVAPPGVTLADCRRPDYWRNNIRECSQTRTGGRVSWNRIEIIAEDGSWEADLRILSVGDGLVHTRLLREFAEAAKPGRKQAVPDGYTVEHIAGNGWRALDANSDLITQRQSTEDAAVRAAIEHAKRAKGDS